MKRETLKAIQKKVALSAVTPTTLHGKGYKGFMKMAREYLSSKIDLSKYGHKSEIDYIKQLDKDTNRMLHKWKIYKRNKAKRDRDDVSFWGAARKVLNIFMRDAIYNHYLRKNYKLQCCERYCEVPLDKKIAKQLRSKEHAGIDNALLKWTTIKDLKPETSGRYQQIAKNYAKKERIPRIHVDACLWPDQK